MAMPPGQVMATPRDDRYERDLEDWRKSGSDLNIEEIMSPSDRMIYFARWMCGSNPLMGERGRGGGGNCLFLNILIRYPAFT